MRCAGVLSVGAVDHEFVGPGGCAGDRLSTSATSAASATSATTRHGQAPQQHDQQAQTGSIEANAPPQWK